MSLSNSERSYGAVAKSFHWLTALLIFSAIPLGLIANDLAHQIQSPNYSGGLEGIERAILLFSMHKTIGVAVFFVALARILWAFAQPKPGLLKAKNRVEALAAETVHWLLYGSLVMVPLTGWIHHAATVGYAPIWWPFGQNLPFVEKSEHIADLFSALHDILVKVLFAAILLHVAGALKHHVIDRDHTLRRMLPGKSDAPTPPAQTHSLLPLALALLIWAGVVGTGAALGTFGSYGHDDQLANGTPEVSETPLPPDASAPDQWAVTDGTLGISVKQLGSAISGQFADWTADIKFTNPDTPGPAGSVTVSIDIASLSLGTVTSQAMGADYFDSATFPKAQFEAELERTEEGYIAKGTLTIRDKALPVSLPFKLNFVDGVAEMQGQMQVNRLDFDIGRSVQDEASLAFAVDIIVNLRATPAP